MFSGIVEEVGTILERTDADGGVRLTIGCALVLDDLAPGASVAVDGVCQTVVSHGGGGFAVQAGGATLDKTTLGALRVGDRVNLERALAVGSRLHGHFVQGHVNATGTVRAWQPFSAEPGTETDARTHAAASPDHDDGGGTWRFEVDIPDHLRRYVAQEGSLAVNGVSLTVAELSGSRVAFSIIPYTAHHTALRDRMPGASVNLEVDMIAKYLESLHIHAPPAPGSAGEPKANPSPVACGVAAATAELAAGGMIIVTDHAARENEGDLVIAAEHVTPAAVNFMVTHARGMVCVPLTAERAARARPAADGAGQQRPAPHRLHRVGRLPARHHHRHLGRRPRRHHRRARRCRRRRRRFRPPRPHVPDRRRPGRRARAARPHRGRHRVDAAGGLPAGGGDLRNHGRRRQHGRRCRTAGAGARPRLAGGQRGTGSGGSRLMQLIEGTYEGAGRRFALVASRTNELITSRLVEGAGDCLRRHGVADDDITVVWVPGAFEIPLAARRVAEQGRFDAVVCLGAVIQGATDHHEYVAGNAAAGIARESAAADVPMTFGIITAASVEHAIQRAGAKQGNLGWNAALAALEMSNVLRRIDELAEQKEEPREEA